MPNLGSAAPEGKPQPATCAPNYAPPRTWLATKLSALPPDVRALLGRAIDSGRVRLLRDDDGAVLVARARP
jgi:hypothetical protein